MARPKHDSTKVADQPIMLADTALLIGKSTAWVEENLIKTNLLPRISFGKFRLGDLCRAVMVHYANQLVRKGAPPPKTAQAALAEAKLKDLERKADIDSGVLRYADEVKETAVTVFGELKLELEGIPSSITRDLEERKKLEKAINDAFARFTTKMLGKMEGPATADEDEEEVDDAA